ncbi:cytochrome c nitrite reductase subunit NrfD [Plesiomonas shigelloides]|uniref:cytochrome c nitrite reductase subunit NrfD n=1 Tax=Plesiomonas shigelloides TaxID=703 RepID=UPI0012625DAA|nr:cytochrome c nitrite reductase subunit NrfD [Plesiomonas shigelloides]KAB7653701.1 cytochrome c nitrite reductase subunit NrfD [Plesiomonas shigelloides]
MTLPVDPFHFPSLVWDWPIAIYLFLLGISAGSVTFAVLLKRKSLGEQASTHGIIKAAALLGPGTVILGLLILIFHLTRPWTFWKLMFNYQFNSVMSMGVMLFQIYMGVLFVWLGGVFARELISLRQHWLGERLNILDTLLRALPRTEKVTEPLLLLLAVLLGAYTGFLLSALKSYPMLNNPVLPVLFLVSGLSSGIASCIVLATSLFKTPADDHGIHFLHRFETPLILTEALLLLCFFTGLWFGDGQKVIAMTSAIGGGFWSNVFWFGVVGLGLLTPLLLGRLLPGKGLTKLLLICCCSLTGILLLRYFILYAGQMTVA